MFWRAKKLKTFNTFEKRWGLSKSLGGRKTCPKSLG